MASLICPNCGRDNPDFLDDCQFCQTPLRREATLNIGEEPTKKSTGELEGILPDWLKEARQQARASAEEEGDVPATKPRVQKEEPQDLLAGLAFQAAADDEEVPDWLKAISPVKEEKKTPAPAEEEAPSDFFAQFNQPEKPVEPAAEEPEAGLPWLSGATEPAPSEGTTDWLSQSGTPDENASMSDLNAPVAQPTPAEPEDLGWLRDLEAASKEPETPASQADMGWMQNLDSASSSQEDLSWLNNLGGVPASSEAAPAEPASSQDDLGWLNNLGDVPRASESAPEQPTSSEEDLGWLSNLGGTPLASEPFQEQPAAPQEDLSWLSDLGGTPAPSQPATPQEDLSWLNNLGGRPAQAEPAQAQEDLSWLNDLSGTPTPSQPESTQNDLSWLSDLGAAISEPQPSEPAPTQPASRESLDWLDNLGGTPAATEPAPAGSSEDLSWLDKLGGTPAPETPEPSPSPFQTDMPDWLKTVESGLPQQPLSPARTAPLSQEAAANIPDWLKSATESASSSLPPLEAAPIPKDKEKSFDELLQGFDQTPEAPTRVPASDQTQREPAPVDQNFFASPADSSTAAPDVDALFNVDMPDWLTQQPETSSESSARPSGGGIPSGLDASLAPADLPSWVQAMRPVESVISEASSATADQTTERQGPLAGFRGVIPFSPIGSAQRPKAISLKLQATDEQQASAALFERIIAGESQPQAVKATTFVASQRALRWGLSAIFLLVLGVMLGLGTQSMPVDVSVNQMAEIQTMSSTILALPEGAPVLVVMDYEPALAGELESAAGPLLDQLTLLRRPNLTFVSTSLSGTALVERLLKNTGINQPVENGGLGYQAGAQYFNLGYLPGGSAGVRGFVEAPQSTMPTAGVGLFSDFAAVILLTDHAESGLVWIEQVELAKQTDPSLVNKPVLVAASAQAGPLLQPYVSSRQVTGMISGLSDAARYEFANNSRPGVARVYWDAFGAGLGIAVIAIVLGSLWSLIAGRRTSRAEAEGG